MRLKKGTQGAPTRFRPAIPPSCGDPFRAVALAARSSTSPAKTSETWSKKKAVKRFPASEHRRLTKDYREKLTLDLRENLVFVGSRVKLTLLRRHGVSEQEQSHRAPRSADTMPAQVSKEIGETVRHPSARFTDSGGHS